MLEVKFDVKDKNQRLVIGALVNMVDEGYSARQTFEILEQIKSNVWSALTEVEMERNPIE